MKIIIAFASVLLSLLPGYSQTGLVIRDVTVIDMVSRSPRSGMTVVVVGNRITRIARNARAPKNAMIVDGRGKFLIPGLWDMHSHFLFGPFRDPFMKLTLANGVTSVRDMGGEQLDQLRQIKQGIADGTMIGPRIFAAGPIVDGPKPVWPFSIPVSTPEEGRKAVRMLKDKGADFVKIYSLLPRDAYLAIADESKIQNMQFAGHVPNGMTNGEASDAGQASIEHTRLFYEVSSDEESLRRELREAEAKGSAELNKLRSAQMSRVLGTFSEEKVRRLAERLVRNRTSFVPTLTVHRSFAYLHEPAFTGDPRLKYVPQLRAYWKTQGEQMSPEAIKQNRPFYEKSVQVVGMLHRGGVNILAGSDTMNPYVFPGFSLHDELVLLAEAGLTPWEALKAATLSPAKFMGRDREVGTVEAGKLADLVLLNANPVADIRNTQKIEAVIFNGKILTRAELDTMLSSLQVAAAP